MDTLVAPTLAPDGEVGMKKTPVEAYVALGACGAALLGSVMDWVTITTPFGELGIAGTKGDGTLTLVAGLLAGVLILLAVVQSKRGLFLPGAVVALLGGAVAVFDMMRVSSIANDNSSDVVSSSVGDGLYLCIVAFAVALVCAWVARSKTAEVVQPPMYPPPGWQNPA